MILVFFNFWDDEDFIGLSSVDRDLLMKILTQFA